MRAGDRVAVAVSGGADSVALLRVLLELRTELGIVLAVAHFNHCLRGENSAADEAFVAELAHELGLEFFGARGNVRDHALAARLSIEAAGRELRYRWFAQLAEEQRFDAIATAHTLDDQAETVLMKFLRGASTQGLAGIYPIVQTGIDKQRAGAEAPLSKGELYGAPKGASLQASSSLYGAPEGASLQISSSNRTSFRARIVRPLLGVSRAKVEAYLTALGQSWREDESNRDRRFLRNRVRHELLPVLEREYRSNIREALGELAEIARGEEDYWREMVIEQLAARMKEDELRLTGFAELPLALQRRVLKSFAESSGPALDFEHVEKLRRCALGKRRKAELPGDRIAERANGTLKIRQLRPDHC